MKKSIVTILSAVALSVVAKADLLYWQINTSSEGNGVYVAPDNGNEAYAYAQIFSSGSSDALTIVALSGTEVTETSVMAGTFANGGVAAIDTSSLTEKSIWIELFNESNDRVYKGAVVSVGDLAQFTATADMTLGWTAVNAWHGQAVPEPTSGLLMILGAAMLGLRRRKVVA